MRKIGRRLAGFRGGGSSFSSGAPLVYAGPLPPPSIRGEDEKSDGGRMQALYGSQLALLEDYYSGSLDRPQQYSSAEEERNFRVYGDEYSTIDEVVNEEPETELKKFVGAPQAPRFFSSGPVTPSQAQMIQNFGEGISSHYFFFCMLFTSLFLASFTDRRELTPSERGLISSFSVARPPPTAVMVVPPDVNMDDGPPPPPPLLAVKKKRMAPIALIPTAPPFLQGSGDAANAGQFVGGAGSGMVPFEDHSHSRDPPPKITGKQPSLFEK